MLVGLYCITYHEVVITTSFDVKKQSYGNLLKKGILLMQVVIQTELPLCFIINTIYRLSP